MKNRCFHCEKKIIPCMRGMPCQCGYEFCTKHRLPEFHECPFDRKAEHLEKSVARINAMKCVAVKIDKI